mmetsp:Transcript_119402/g.349350  ORF Transcript_119402/g.349350 Transcript_119402/m.349350 type:complete len:412 (+) Transcript_119402:976-2211(+)
MLQALAVQRRPPVGAADQEASSSHVRGLPDAVAHALEAEHRVVDEEGQRGRLLGGVGRRGGDPRHDGAALADALLEDLSVGRLRILHHLVCVDRLVVLSKGGVDLEDREEGVEAEGSGLVRDHECDALSELSALHHLAKDLREGHCRAHLPGGACIEHVVCLFVRRQLNQRRNLSWLPRGQVSAQSIPLLLHILCLGRVLARVHKVAGIWYLQLLVADRDVQRVAELCHVRVGHHLLLVDGVSPEEGLQAVALERLHKNDGRAATHFSIRLRLFEGCIDLLLVVSAWHLECLEELFVAPVGHAVQKTRLLEDVFPNEGAVSLGMQPLTVTVRDFLKSFDELAIMVSLDKLAELTTPNQLDHIKACTAERALKLLHDLRVPAHGPIQPLVVAVHYEDHVVELLSAGHGYRCD